MTDDDLITEMRKGNRKAGNALARRYYHDLNTYYRKRVAEEEANELTQLTLLETVGRIERFRGESSFHHYVFSVARRIMADHQRREARRLATTQAPTSEPLAHQTSATERLARAELLERIVAAVETLEEHYQSVLNLKLGGANNLEIAEVLDIHYNTVRSRLSRGIAAIRTLLGDSLDEFFRAFPPEAKGHGS